MNPEILDRIPPCDVGAERAVLGCVLLDGKRVDDVVPILHSEDFHTTAYGVIFRHILAQHEAGEPVDDVTLLANRLKSAGDLELAGGTTGLADILHGAGAPSNASRYAGVSCVAAL